MNWIMQGLAHTKSTKAGAALVAVLGILWAALHGTVTSGAGGTVVSVTLPADWSTWLLGLVPLVAGALWRPGMTLPKVAPVLLLVAFVGCSTPISGNPVQDLAQQAAKPLAPSVPSLGGVVLQGLQDATWNLDQAVAVGALDKADPAPGCFHGMLGQLGMDPANPAPPAASFEPKVSDLISAGSVLYIRVQQAKKLQGGGIAVAPSCKELIAQFMLDAAAAGANALPGGGALIKLR